MEAPPEAGVQTVRSHISQLRKMLGADCIETADGGYRLALAEGALDADRFENELTQARAAIAAGEPTAAVGALKRGLSRWRGRALADVEGAAWAEAEAARLQEGRLDAEELLLEARLAAGQTQAAVGEAEAAVIAQPLRERRWAALMLALYRSGRQADALEAFRRLRTTLEEELGIDPSPQLVVLEQAVLRQDPGLGAPATTVALDEPPDRPAGAVTVLVTDARPEDSLLAELTAEHGGALVDEGMAAFPSPAAAVVAAVASREHAAVRAAVHSEDVGDSDAVRDHARELLVLAQPGQIPSTGPRPRSSPVSCPPP